jgi:hypothetical protein
MWWWWLRMMNIHGPNASARILADSKHSALTEHVGEKAAGMPTWRCGMDVHKKDSGEGGSTVGKTSKY